MGFKMIEEDDLKITDTDSIEKLTEEQLKKINEMEKQYGDKYTPVDDATQIINSEEIESKLNKGKTSLSKSDTTDLQTFENTLDKDLDEYSIANIKSNGNKEEEEVMPRRTQKRKRSSKKNRRNNQRSNSKNLANNKKTAKGKKSTTSNKKGKKKNKKKLSKFRIILRAAILLFLVLILIGVGVVFAYVYGVFGNQKPLTKEDLVINKENSTVYDRSGKLVATLAQNEKREIITLSDMPDYVPKMYIAIEDERFYKHKGVDFKRTFGATVQYILKGGSSDYGASTLTQQLIKNITDDDDQNWRRKVREITRALQVEREISKEQVLELYLNVIFIGGDNIHGVALGADYYFAKSQKNLTIAEAAFLAGINHMPNAYNPFLVSAKDLSEKEAKKIDEDDKIAKKDKEKKKLEKAKELQHEKINNRTLTVLDKIYKDLKWISEEDYNKAVEEVEKGLKFKNGQKSKSTLKYSYITDAAIEEVIVMLMKEKEISRELAEMQLYNGGYKIYTTQNSAMQTIAQNEMKKEYYRITSRKTKDKKGNYVKSQASITIIDHKTGQVLVAVGGLGDQVTMYKGDWNRTTRTLRQLGSSMKPIGVVAPGLESGKLTAATVYDDTPYGGFNNFGYGYRGYTNIRKAVEVSNNIVFLKAVGDMGEKTSADYLRKNGFRIVKEDENISSLALGGLTYGVSSTQVAGAYAAIANDGVFIEPTFLLKVENKDGKVVLKPEQRKERVLSKQNAFILQKIMTSTVVGPEGTGYYAAISGFETGVKTGTTNDDRDRWLCGFTPKLTAAAWYGFDVAEYIRWYDVNPAGLIWRNIMRPIHAKYYKSGARFVQPEGVVQISVCRDSGKLPDKFCSKDPRGNRVYKEYFAEGTEPSEKCDHHEEIEVCKVSGLLPSDNCDNRVKKVFLKKDNNLRSADRKYKAPTNKCTKCAQIEVDNKNKAEQVTKMIAQLPNVDALTLADEGKVNAASTAYNKLSAPAKALVPQESKDKLNVAIAKIKELKESEEEKPEEPEEPEEP